MDLTFLGTSGGTPTKTRNVTGLALAHGRPRQWYLIDCGEGTQHRLLHTPLSVMQLRAIFITHVHGDHTFGLPGLLTSASMLGRTEPCTWWHRGRFRRSWRRPWPIPTPPWAMTWCTRIRRRPGSSGRTTLCRSPPCRCRTGCPVTPSYSPKETRSAGCARHG